MKHILESAEAASVTVNAIVAKQNGCINVYSESVIILDEADSILLDKGNVIHKADKERKKGTVIGLTAAGADDMLECEKEYLSGTAGILLRESNIKGNMIDDPLPISLEEFMKDNGGQARLVYVDEHQVDTIT